MPRTAPWLAEFITELIGFPNARHDDQADALAQILANSPRENLCLIAGPMFHPNQHAEPDNNFGFLGGI